SKIELTGNIDVVQKPLRPKVKCKVSTVCSVLIDIITNRSEAQLCKVLQYYGQLSKDGFAKYLENLVKLQYGLVLQGFHSEIDLLKIIREYKRMNGKSLQEDFCGDYEKILLAVCGTQ
uniref:Uncharacterized protein n=1 Tax=Sinocyclocheilus grahami TaxID=75366 RepID=A0A672MY35_SINGR